ncbi:hypothetical protein GEV33_001519 [Tenebrio molitor]|uniref:Uncharacterized protein n=1 Tax=Tenebrio molitor TaxID=7067 RepID=A0A8J6LJR0_TENMO|nr:hypothetical protein GEV33_001519 [Tenebrio molitor]
MDGSATGLLFVASGSCCSGIWNRKEKRKKEQGGSEGLTGVDVLSPESLVVFDGYRVVKGVESTSSWRSSGSSV